jgi:hypothetical protein
LRFWSPIPLPSPSTPAAPPLFPLCCLPLYTLFLSSSVSLEECCLSELSLESLSLSLFLNFISSLDFDFTTASHRLPTLSRNNARETLLHDKCCDNILNIFGMNAFSKCRTRKGGINISFALLFSLLPLSLPDWNKFTISLSPPYLYMVPIPCLGGC